MNKRLEELRRKASEAYYDGNPIITDEEYDALFGTSGPVGTGAKGDIAHHWPMWSLQNYFIGEGEPPLNERCIITPKLDGAAISLLYKDRVLIRALTRGDGVKGKNILPNLQHLVPTELPELLAGPGYLQLTGEVVADINVENARNVAAGALGLKDDKEFIKRIEECGLHFFVYGLETDGGENSLYEQDLWYANDLGFNTVLECDSSFYPTDGRVYRVRENSRYRDLGYTAKHPRGAYAEKTREKPVETTLLDVIWQTGKSGKVTPVAILKEIVIDDAKITRATLNNMAYIDALGLEIGCQVNVIRAGKIIPCVVGRA